MSLSGLNSGLYQQFSLYAELTDKALVELNEGTGFSRENSQKLGNLFVELNNLRRDNISARLIWILLTEEMNLKEEEIHRAGESLLKSDDKEKIGGLLENLARTLAEEQSVIRARLSRGVRRR
jgi:hypothetical protein